MIRRPPRSTLDRSSAASDVYKRQDVDGLINACDAGREGELIFRLISQYAKAKQPVRRLWPVSYTHLRAHETVLDLVCRLLLEKKKKKICLLYTSPYKIILITITDINTKLP